MGLGASPIRRPSISKYTTLDRMNTSPMIQLDEPCDVANVMNPDKQRPSCIQLKQKTDFQHQHNTIGQCLSIVQHELAYINFYNVIIWS